MESLRGLYDGTSLHVRCYDSLHDAGWPDIGNDIDFYLNAARDAVGPVLEIGAGTGRVTLPLAAEGIDITGLELSESMLRVAQGKVEGANLSSHPRFRQGDMRDFDLGEPFALVIVPLRAFQLLLTLDDQRKALSCFRAHLRDGGVLILHLFDPKLDLLVPGAETLDVEFTGTDGVTGLSIEAELVELEIDPVQQVRHEHWRYVLRGNSGAVAEEENFSQVMRWIYRWEMQHLLALERFAVTSEYSDFHGAAPAYAREQIWVCRAE